MFSHIAHDDYPFLQLEGHPQPFGRTSFPDILPSFHLLNMQTGMPQIFTQQAERLANAASFGIRELLISLFELLGKKDIQVTPCP
jgi:hypothetical protein